MGTIECSQPASKSYWDSQDFGDIIMVLKMAHFPPGHDELKYREPGLLIFEGFHLECCLHARH